MTTPISESVLANDGEIAVSIPVRMYNRDSLVSFKGYRHVCTHRRTDLTRKEFLDLYPTIAEEEKIEKLERFGITQEELEKAMQMARAGAARQNLPKLIREARRVAITRSLVPCVS